MSIKQVATIVKIEDGNLYLSVCRPEACAACKAQSACSSGGEAGRSMVLADDGRGRKVGDQVVLKIGRTQGFLAIILAYMIPVALIVGLLLGMQAMQMSEGLMGGLVLGVLVLYFVLLRVFRRRFEGELSIEIE